MSTKDVAAEAKTARQALLDLSEAGEAAVKKREDEIKAARKAQEKIEYGAMLAARAEQDVIDEAEEVLAQIKPKKADKPTKPVDKKDDDSKKKDKADKAKPDDTEPKPKKADKPTKPVDKKDDDSKKKDKADKAKPDDKKSKKKDECPEPPVPPKWSVKDLVAGWSFWAWFIAFVFAAWAIMAWTALWPGIPLGLVVAYVIFAALTITAAFFVGGAIGARIDKWLATKRAAKAVKPEKADKASSKTGK